MARLCALLLFALLLAGCGSESSQTVKMKEGQLVLGTEQREAYTLLKGLGGVPSEAVSNIASAQLWILKAHQISVETQIEGGVVSHLNVWDWRERDAVSDHASISGCTQPVNYQSLELVLYVLQVIFDLHPVAMQSQS